MTRSHPGHPTQPLMPGAPLPPQMMNLPPIRPEDVEDELTRARVELLYACAMHRKAWKKMRQVKLDREADAESKGVPAYLDNDVFWKIAVGDVRWWREEMAAQSSAILALWSMANEVDE